jgi:hypothetical protein
MFVCSTFSVQYQYKEIQFYVADLEVQTDTQPYIALWIFKVVFIYFPRNTLILHLFSFQELVLTLLLANVGQW